MTKCYSELPDTIRLGQIGHLQLSYITAPHLVERLDNQYGTCYDCYVIFLDERHMHTVIWGCEDVTPTARSVLDFVDERDII